MIKSSCSLVTSGSQSHALCGSQKANEKSKASLQVKKQKIENCNAYFKEMAAHFEAKNAAMAENVESVASLNTEKERLKEQLAEADALYREQCLRNEDGETLQQQQQRLKQDISFTRLQLEELKRLYDLGNISWYNGREKLQQQLTEVQEHFKKCTTDLSSEIPRAVLDDFDLHPVEDARSLHRHQVANDAAFAELSRLLDEAEKKLLCCIRQNNDLCEEYSFNVETLERELKLKQELLSMQESCYAKQKAEEREEARELDEEYAELRKKIFNLEQRIQQVERKGAQEAEKRLAKAKMEMDKAIAERKEAMAASDEELSNFREVVTASYKEHWDIMKECHDKLIDAIEELHKT